MHRSSVIVGSVAGAVAIATIVVALTHCQPAARTGIKTGHPPSPTPGPVVIVGIQTERWADAKIRPEKEHFVEAIAQTVSRNRSRYETVAAATGVPWDVIGAIHNLECGLSFRQHLFNGDPLTARTYHVPAGQPRSGSPPFQWEDSAIAALRFDALDRVNWRSMEAWLWSIEKYNGQGYEKYHSSVPTPYLWSWTTLYVRGKYIADGTWSATAVSEQCGVVPILKVLR